MKKFGLLFLSLFIASFAFAQNENETEGSTMMQPVRPPVETPWKQVDIGEFSDPVPYPPERQADIMYYNIIWRTIDLREKMNHPLYFPTEQRGTWRSLAQVIFDAIDLQNPENPNSLPVYQDEFCTTPYSKDEIKGALVQIRRIPQIDPETGETIDEIEIEEAHEAKDVLSYNLREIWFFDKQSSTYKVHILSLEPIVEYEKPNESSYQEE
ncbi:MAG: gliding motility protein GldN, partial [Bacteroidales bacterium]